MLRSTILFTGFLLTGLSAQSISGPATAWYFHPVQRSLRTIAGLPGAASLGPTLMANLDGVVAAPGCRRALVQRQGEWSLFPNAGPSLVSGLIAAEKAAWSANGETALLAGNGQFQMLRQGVASAAQPLPTGHIQALAVSPKGTQGALVIDGVLYRVSEQNELQTGFPLTATALAWTSDNTLYALDRPAGRLSKVTASNTEPFAEIPEPLGLTEDSSGRRVVVAARAIVLLQPDGAIERHIDTGAQVSAWQPGCHADHIVLETLAELSIFRSDQQPTLFFVPAPAKEEN